MAITHANTKVNEVIDTLNRDTDFSSRPLYIKRHIIRELYNIASAAICDVRESIGLEAKQSVKAIHEAAHETAYNGSEE